MTTSLPHLCKVSVPARPSLRILVADDHDLVRYGLQVLIEREEGWKVCSHASSGHQAIAEARKHRPNIAILDMSFPDMDGLEVTRQIHEAVPECEILIFTGAESDDLIRAVYESGAKGFIVKSEAVLHLVNALRNLADHKPFFTDHVSDVIFARFAHQPRDRAEARADGRLEPEERALVALLSTGHSNSSAARELKVSERTVENWRSRIMAKLKLTTFADLVRYAVRNKIVSA